MRVQLPEALDKYVREQVASGLYDDASDVIREALRLKIHIDTADQIKLDGLRQDIDIAWQHAERGEFADFDPKTIEQELDEELSPRADG